jgi:hypothetical protein
MGGNLNVFKVSVAESLKERDHLEYLHTDGRARATTRPHFSRRPHFEGLNYRPGGIYNIKANVSSWIARVFWYHLTPFLLKVLFKNVCFVILSN